MDSRLYIELVQNRTFLALCGLVVSLFLQTMLGTLLRHRADPRPLMERLADLILYPLSFRLNRPGRSDGALIMRGFIILVLGCVLFFGVTAYGLSLAHKFGAGGTFFTVMVAFSVGTVGWFAPLRALSRALDNPRAPRPYLILSHATYSNLVTLDDSGLIRVGVTAAIKSLTMRLAAPVILFILFGWQALAIYWPVMMLAQATGQDGNSRAFAAIINLVANIFLFIPTLLMFPVVFVSLFFSAGASFFRAIPGFFRITRWPRFLQGGLPMLITAYAMKLALGGPRQDREGKPVKTAWIGPDSGTAQLNVKDIGRVLYLQGVTLLLFGAALFIVAAIA